MSNGAGEHGCADWPKDSADFQAKPHSRIRLEPVFTGRLSFLTLRYPNQDWVKLKQSKGTRIDYSVAFHNKSLKEYLPQSKGKLSDFLPEFYHVHGDSDYVIDVNLTRCFTRELGNKGLRYIYRELDGVNHSKVFQGNPINMVVNDDVFRWIHATRNKILPLSETDKATLATIKRDVGAMSNFIRVYPFPSVFHPC